MQKKIESQHIQLASHKWSLSWVIKFRNNIQLKCKWYIYTPICSKTKFRRYHLMMKTDTHFIECTPMYKISTEQERKKIALRIRWIRRIWDAEPNIKHKLVQEFTGVFFNWKILKRTDRTNERTIQSFDEKKKGNRKNVEIIDLEPFWCEIFWIKFIFSDCMKWVSKAKRKHRSTKISA